MGGRYMAVSNYLRKQWREMSFYNRVMLVAMCIEIGLLIVIVVQGFL